MRTHADGVRSVAGSEHDIERSALNVDVLPLRHVHRRAIAARLSALRHRLPRRQFCDRKGTTKAPLRPERVVTNLCEPVASKEPSKRWLNWWRAVLPCEIAAPNQTLNLKSGAEFHSAPFPSKDIAEQYAADEMARNGNAARAIRYLGAFPEGERP